MIGPSDLKFTGHAEGAAKILKARKNCAPRDAFERLLLLSLRGPVVSILHATASLLLTMAQLFEGLFNPNINLSPKEWKELVQSDLDAHTPEGEMLTHFSRVPDILDRVKANPDGLAGLLILQAEMKSLYFKTRNICDLLRLELDQIENPGEIPHPNPYNLSPTMLHAHTQRFYGICITICLYMNYILVAMRTNDPELPRDANYLALETLSIAENALQYRPFGAGYVTLALVAGVMAVDKPSLRILLESWAADYWEDFNMPNLDFAVIVESFRRLDPFASADTPDGWPEAEEAALYDPVLFKEESESPKIVDFIS